MARCAEQREQRHLAAPDANPQALIKSAELRAHLDRHVARVSARLERFEQVKYYDVLADDFTVDNGLLTPTLKIRRNAVNTRYHARFERLYRVASGGGEADASTSRTQPCLRSMHDGGEVTVRIRFAA